MAEITILTRYDRECLETLLGTTTEERLKEEGHTFTLTDGTVYHTDVVVSPTKTIVIEEGQQTLMTAQSLPEPDVQHEPEPETTPMGTQH
jgi:hypothetical protein